MNRLDEVIAALDLGLAARRKLLDLLPPKTPGYGLADFPDGDIALLLIAREALDVVRTALREPLPTAAEKPQ